MTTSEWAARQVVSGRCSHCYRRRLANTTKCVVHTLRAKRYSYEQRLKRRCHCGAPSFIPTGTLCEKHLRVSERLRLARSSIMIARVRYHEHRLIDFASYADDPHPREPYVTGIRYPRSQEDDRWFQAEDDWRASSTLRGAHIGNWRGR